MNQTTLFGEMVSSLDGTVMDSFTLTKPVGWINNATAKAAALGIFEPNITLAENWVDTYGIDGGITTAASPKRYINSQLVLKHLFAFNHK